MPLSGPRQRRRQRRRQRLLRRQRMVFDPFVPFDHLYGNLYRHMLVFREALLVRGGGLTGWIEDHLPDPEESQLAREFRWLVLFVINTLENMGFQTIIIRR